MRKCISKAKFSGLAFLDQCSVPFAWRLLQFEVSLYTAAESLDGWRNVAYLQVGKHGSCRKHGITGSCFGGQLPVCYLWRSKRTQRPVCFHVRSGYSEACAAAPQADIVTSELVDLL